MPDDLRELVARYAAGSLSEEERARLFDAALADQDLFDELAAEQGIRQLLAEPGARGRIERALEPAPKHAAWWMLAASAGAIAAGVMLFEIMRPVPKAEPQVVAVVNPPPPQAAPVAAPAGVQRLESPARNEVRKQTPTKKEAAEQAAPKVAEISAPAAAPAAGAALDIEQRQSARAAAPRQTQVLSAQSAFAPIPPVAFHYSMEAGHLKILASTAGFLTIRTGAGVLLYATQMVAAGATVDVAVPDDAASVVVTHSYSGNAAATKPEPRAEPSGDLLAPGTAAMELKIPR